MTSTPADAKIVDLLKKREEGSKPFVSIEFFPPRTEVGVTVRSDEMSSSLGEDIVCGK
jgi:hypothetical protein